MVRIPHPARFSANAKLNRANEHLQLLIGEIESFRNRETHTVTRHDYAERRPDAVVSEWVVKVVEPPPERWSAVLGDLIHNLRSALDHIVWGLSGPNPTYPKAVSFPVFQTRAEFNRQTGRSLADVSVPARAEIEALQPYNNTDYPVDLHPLWLVRELSNVDKHRALNVVLNMVHEVTITLIPPVKPRSTD